MATADNYYWGLKNGVSTKFDDTTLSGADAGSISTAAIGDSIYGGTGTDTGFGMDWLNTNAKGLGTLANVGGLGLSAYDTFFGDTAKKNKLAIESMKLQNANNKELMADKQAFQDTWAKASNGLGTVKS